MSEMWRNYGLRKTAQIAMGIEKGAMTLPTFFGALNRTIANGFNKVKNTFNHNATVIERTNSRNALAAKQGTGAPTNAATTNAATTTEGNALSTIKETTPTGTQNVATQAADQAAQAGGNWKKYLAAGAGGLGIGAIGMSVMNSANGVAQQQPMMQQQMQQPQYPIQG